MKSIIAVCSLAFVMLSSMQVRALFVESGIPCSNGPLREQLISKCEFLCPAQLVPYYDCPVQTGDFTCYCIAQSKADCFQQCLNNNSPVVASGDGNETDATTTSQVQHCRGQCAINGDDGNMDGVLTEGGISIGVTPSSDAASTAPVLYAPTMLLVLAVTALLAL